MAQTVIIPTPLRKFTDGVELVRVQCATIGDVFQQLESQYPGIKARLCEENGDLRRFINVYVDGEDIRFLNKLETVVGEQSEISIVPAIAGG
jgi:sulfur-carrier protein